MLDWFKKRSSEASTWGGLGLVAATLGGIFKIDEAPVVTEGLNTAAAAVSGGMSWWQALLVGIGGAAMAIKSDGDTGF